MVPRAFPKTAWWDASGGVLSNRFLAEVRDHSSCMTHRFCNFCSLVKEDLRGESRTQHPLAGIGKLCQFLRFLGIMLVYALNRLLPPGLWQRNPNLRSRTCWRWRRVSYCFPCTCWTYTTNLCDSQAGVLSYVTLYGKSSTLSRWRAFWIAESWHQNGWKSEWRSAQFNEQNINWLSVQSWSCYNLGTAMTRQAGGFPLLNGKLFLIWSIWLPFQAFYNEITQKTQQGSYVLHH